MTSEPIGLEEDGTVVAVVGLKNVPEAIRGLDTLASPDYVDLFTVTTSGAREKSAEEWVRVVLETTPGPPGLLRPLYRLFFRRIVPLLGRLIAGDGTAYTYLPESTLAFLEPARLVDLLREQGLVDVTSRRLALGCVAVTAGRKPVMLAATGGTK